MKNKKSKIYLILVIILLIVIGLIIKIKENKSSGEVEREITPVYGSIQTFISITGTVQPQNRLEIKPQISGRIEEILVKEGDRVKIGQTLAWMSSTERAALLDAARSQDEKTLKNWQEVYKPAPLIAPIDGEVIVRAFEPGQTVSSNDAVIVLSDRLIIKAQADETDVGKIKTPQAAIISLDAYPNIKIKGKVGHISYESKVINNVTMYEVDILPETVPEVFRSGMSANVNIIQRSKDNILLIPLEAVKQNEDKDFVLLSKGKDNKSTEQRVKLGISDGKNVEVISGLTPEDKIIVKDQKLSGSKNTNSRGNPFMPSGRGRR